MSDAFFHKVFGDSEPTHLGSGWVSGVLGVFFGLLGLGGALCLHFPALLTLPEARSHYPMVVIRLLIQGTIAAAFVLAGLSAILRQRKVLALTAGLLAAVALLLGGGSTALPNEVGSHYGIGFDWFLLDLLVMTVVFVPVERFWPLHRRLAVPLHRHRHHARPGHDSDDGVRLPAERAGGLPRVRVLPRHVLPHRFPPGCALAGALPRDGALSSLASRRGQGRGERQLRDPFSLSRSPVRHPSSAERRLARALRPAGRHGPARLFRPAHRPVQAGGGGTLVMKPHTLLGFAIILLQAAAAATFAPPATGPWARLALATL